MNNLLKSKALTYDIRLQIIAPYHLNDLKNDIDTFVRNETLNDFQKWIVNDLYDYRIPDIGFAVRSIILLALPHPFYAEVLLNKNGKEYMVKSLVRSDFDTAERILKSFLQKHGYLAEPAQNLPLKRLGVQSGFSEYGRNNITYIEGMGSNFSLTAYFSDLPCEDDTWREAIIAKACAECNICLNNCPTRAIRKDKFLIDNQKCLSAINETPGDFPQWLPASVHHTCYNCLRCQEKCPMNLGHIEKMNERIVFSEQETEMLLEGKPIEDFSESAKRKIYLLGFDNWYGAIPRNIKALMDCS